MGLGGTRSKSKVVRALERPGVDFPGGSYFLEGALGGSHALAKGFHILDAPCDSLAAAISSVTSISGSEVEQLQDRQHPIALGLPGAEAGLAWLSRHRPLGAIDASESQIHEISHYALP